MTLTINKTITLLVIFIGVVYQLFILPRGFDITDEGFALMMLVPNIKTNDYGLFLIKKLVDLLNTDLKVPVLYIRIFRLLFSYVALIPWWIIARKKHNQSKLLICFLSVLGVSVSYTFLSPGLSYDSLGAILLTFILGLTFLVKYGYGKKGLNIFLIIFLSLCLITVKINAVLSLLFILIITLWPYLNKFIKRLIVFIPVVLLLLIFINKNDFESIGYGSEFYISWLIRYILLTVFIFVCSNDSIVKEKFFLKLFVCGVVLYFFEIKGLRALFNYAIVPILLWVLSFAYKNRKIDWHTILVFVAISLSIIGTNVSFFIKLSFFAPILLFLPGIKTINFHRVFDYKTISLFSFLTFCVFTKMLNPYRTSSYFSQWTKSDIQLLKGMKFSHSEARMFNELKEKLDKNIIQDVYAMNRVHGIIYLFDFENVTLSWRCSKDYFKKEFHQGDIFLYTNIFGCKINDVNGQKYSWKLFNNKVFLVTCD